MRTSDVSPGWAAVHAAADRYRAALAEACPGLAPLAVPAADAPCLGWARFCHHWPRSRPHRVALHMLGVDPDAAAETLRRCRAVDRRRVAQVQAAVQGLTAELLDRCEATLEPVARPDPAAVEALDRLAELGLPVEVALGRVPADDLALRLARSLRALPDDRWPAGDGGLEQALRALDADRDWPPEVAFDLALEFAPELRGEQPPPWAGTLTGLVRHARTLRPPRLDLADLPPGDGHGVLRAAFPTPTPLASEWLDWTRTPAGAGWLHGAVTGNQPQLVAWAWRAVELADARLVPTPQGAGWSWPTGVPVARPGVRFTRSDAPAGAVLRVSRCATDPDLAGAVLGLGPDPDPGAELAAAVWAAVADKAALRAAVAPPVEAALDGRKPDADGVLPLLDVLVTASAPTAVADAVAGWLAALEFTLLPGAGADPDWVREQPAFRNAEPAGAVVRVREYGLARAGEVVRRAAVTVSAGPPPAGLAELEQAVARAPDGVRGDLEVALKAWRAAGRRGELAEAVVGFFERFWSDWAAPWAGADPDGAAEAGYRLDAVAHGLGYRVFRPIHLQDHPPRWVRLPPGQRPLTGRVTRLVAPGLADPAGQLRVAAVAEVE